MLVERKLLIDDDTQDLHLFGHANVDPVHAQEWGVALQFKRLFATPHCRTHSRATIASRCTSVAVLPPNARTTTLVYACPYSPFYSSFSSGGSISRFHNIGPPIEPCTQPLFVLLSYWIWILQVPSYFVTLVVLVQDIP